MAAQEHKSPTHRRARSDAGPCAEQLVSPALVVRPRARSHNRCRALVEPAFIPALLNESPKAPASLAEIFAANPLHYKAVEGGGEEVESGGEEDLPSSAPPQAHARVRRSHLHSHRGEGGMGRRVKNVRHSTGTTTSLSRKNCFRSLQQLESNTEFGNLGRRKGALMNLITAARSEVDPFGHALEDPFGLVLTA